MPSSSIRDVIDIFVGLTLENKVVFDSLRWVDLHGVENKLTLLFSKQVATTSLETIRSKLSFFLVKTQEFLRHQHKQVFRISQFI